MRIGIFTNCYKPFINGVVRSVSVFRAELIRQGHAVYVFAPETPDHSRKEPQTFGYPAFELERPVAFPVAIPFSPAIDKAIAQLDLDVIHSQHPVLLGREAARQAQRCNVPLVFTYHSHYEAYADYMPFSKGVFRAYTQWLLGRYLDECQRIIAPSESARCAIAHRYPRVVGRLAILPTPLDLSLYANLAPLPVREQYGLQGAFIFIVVSRLAREKGLDALLHAFTLVARRRDNARMLVVGEGPHRKALLNRLHDLKLKDRVILTGPVPFEQVPSYLIAADAFAYASPSETQGLVLLEAMAAGLPVVTLDRPWSRDLIVPEENGLLAADVRGLPAAMQRLLDDEPLRRKLASNARATAAAYDAPGLARNLAAIYEAAQRERKPR